MAACASLVNRAKTFRASPINTGESLNRISIVIVPDPFFPAPTQKEKSGLATRDYPHTTLVLNHMTGTIN